MTNTAQPSFTPGPWHVIPHAFPGAHHRDRPIVDDAGDTIALIRGDGVVDSIRDGNANLVKSAPSLYAYAKAEALRKELANAVLAELDENTNVAPGTGDAAERVYRSHLATMGWDGKEYPSDFLVTYRATALALAEGGGNE